MKRKELPLTDEEIRRRYEAGESTVELAKMCGSNPNMISRRIIAAGGQVRSLGESNLKSLPISDKEIRRRYEAGETTDELGELCKCDPSVISRRIKAVGGEIRSHEKELPLLDEEMLSRYEGGESTVKLAEVCGCDVSTISRRIRVMGGQIRPSSESLKGRNLKSLPITDEEIRRRYEAGEKLNGIGEICGCSSHLIKRRIIAAGGEIRSLGESNLKSLLITDEEIRRRYEAGESTGELAEVCGCVHAVICRRIRAVGGEIRTSNEYKQLPVTNEELCRRYEAGESTGELAKVFGVDASLIWRRIKSVGGEIRSLGVDNIKEFLISDEEIRRRYEAGESTVHLSKICGCSSDTISRRIVSAGGEICPMGESRRIKLPITDEEIRRRYEAGEHSYELAKECGCDYTVITRRIKAAGGQIRGIGESQRVKLPITDEELRRRHEAGESTVELANICGCGHHVICRRIRAVGGEVIRDTSGARNPSWKGGISFEPYCPKFNDALKEEIREKYGRVCALCGKTEEANGRKLSVHHIDRNKMQGCDDHDWLIIPLCNSCHGKAHTADMEEKLMNDVSYIPQVHLKPQTF